MSTLQKAALEYARHGWHVFPCEQNGKVPLTADGLKSATTDKTEIEKAWGLRPNANVAIHCGRSGLVVIDEDKDGAIEGLLTQLDANTREVVRQAFEATLRARTGKGVHYYFLAPQGVELHPRAKIVEGVDPRAGESYVIAPPSRHANGGQYRWINKDAEPLPLPKALIPILVRPREDATAELRGSIPIGERNTSAFKIACTLARQGLNSDSIFKVLLDMRDQGIIQHSDSDPFTEQEIRQVAESAVKTVARSGNLRLDAVWATDVQDRKVEYDWQPYLPHGMLTVLAGVQGDGKTFVAVDIAAHITRGESMPKFIGQRSDSEIEPRPGRVLYIGEDSDYVLKQRFAAAGADLDRVRIVRGKKQSSDPQAFRSGITIDDLPLLRHEIEQVKPDLVVIDPAQSFTGGKINMSQANEVRSVLGPLVSLADEKGFTLLIICHTSKAQQSHAIFKVLGSVDFTAAARSVLFVLPEAEQSGTKALVHVKSTNAPEGASLRFGLDAVGETPRVSWKGFSPLTKADVNAPEHSQGRGRPEVTSAIIKERILQALREKRGPVEERLLLADVRGDGGIKKAVFREMLRDGTIEIAGGKGVRGDPHLYRLKNAGLKIPPPAGFFKPESEANADNAVTQDGTMHDVAARETASIVVQNAGLKNPKAGFSDQNPRLTLASVSRGNGLDETTAKVLRAMGIDAG